MTDVAAYRWIVDYERSSLAAAACVTVVRGLDVAGTVLAFGGDPTVPPEPLQRVVEHGGSMEVAAARHVGDVVVVVEPSGFQGSRPEVLRGASRTGMAVSVFWNVNLVCRFSHAVDGNLVASFDPLFPDQRFGSDPDRLLPDVEGLPFGIDNDPIPAAFALAERVTGRALSREDMEGLIDSWLLVPQLSDLHAVPAEYHSLRYHHPELVERVAGVGPDVQRELAAMAAERAAAASGLDREPGVRSALAGLRTAPGGPLPKELAELVRQLLHRSSAAFSAFYASGTDQSRAPAEEASRPAHAANALYHATNPDPLSAAVDALDSARHVVGDGLLAEAQARCE